MGRTNKAPEADELMPEIPLSELKKLKPGERISVIEAHNYMRAGQNPRPIVDSEAEQGSE